ncbi:hypothetical protein SISSUDRAFT_562328 [Sistotremastrum suecicum HHB10207 ss-3]|uniref:Uncharacterized protein n=1 Tax=Sistotremastrum suecicum HHB10207 ss-3 TaxID=1314776 RepID=A0A166ESU9_9AGAM|nr:hypothetical protein SISSUDRAFT_562328 [Sistotremastrum suecicum HHB10207 ss-3]
MTTANLNADACLALLQLANANGGTTAPSPTPPNMWTTLTPPVLSLSLLYNLYVLSQNMGWKWSRVLEVICQLQSGETNSDSNDPDGSILPRFATPATASRELSQDRPAIVAPVTDSVDRAEPDSTRLDDTSPPVVTRVMTRSNSIAQRFPSANATLLICFQDSGGQTQARSLSPPSMPATESPTSIIDADGRPRLPIISEVTTPQRSQSVGPPPMRCRSPDPIVENPVGAYPPAPSRRRRPRTRRRNRSVPALCSSPRGSVGLPGDSKE